MDSNEMFDNPLGGVETNQPEQQHGQTVPYSGGLEAIERGQLDMQIMTAKRNPRTLSKVKVDMLSFATLDKETAAACYYTLPRGEKPIQGPSVRLAEIAVSCYGNMRVGTRVVEVVDSGNNPHVVVQGLAHDLEKNTAVCIEKRRRITAKKRNHGRIDEDDINLAVNACSAIAFRDAAFKVIPQALIKPVYDKAKLIAAGSSKDLATRRSEVISRLNELGVDTPRILGAVNARTIEDIDLDKLSLIIGLGTAVKDGETTMDTAFPRVVDIKAAAVPNHSPTTATEPKPKAKASTKKDTPPPTAEPAAQPLQAVLERIVTEDLKSYWGAFYQSAVSLGWLSDSAEVSKFSDLPEDVAKTALDHMAELQKAIEAIG